MRCGLLVIALAGLALPAAACSTRGSTGPAWPKERIADPDSGASDDGGESIEPRAAAQAIAAIEGSASKDEPERTEDKPAAAPEAAAAAAAASKPGTVSTETLTPEEEAMMEEIVIEIED